MWLFWWKRNMMKVDTTSEYRSHLDNKGYLVAYQWVRWLVQLRSNPKLQRIILTRHHISSCKSFDWQHVGQLPMIFKMIWSSQSSLPGTVRRCHSRYSEPPGIPTPDENVWSSSQHRLQHHDASSFSKIQMINHDNEFIPWWCSLYYSRWLPHRLTSAKEK